MPQKRAKAQTRPRSLGIPSHPCRNFTKNCWEFLPRVRGFNEKYTGTNASAFGALADNNYSLHPLDRRIVRVGQGKAVEACGRSLTASPPTRPFSHYPPSPTRGPWALAPP
eukprot:1202422-Rhodomonas_salina.1